MDRGVLRALVIGYRGGLYAWPTNDGAEVRVNGGYLEHGPLATADAIATAACRYVVERRSGMRDELAVMRLVEDHGFVYTPPGTWPANTNAHAASIAARAAALCS